MKMHALAVLLCFLISGCGKEGGLQGESNGVVDDRAVAHNVFVFVPSLGRKAAIHVERRNLATEGRLSFRDKERAQLDPDTGLRFLDVADEVNGSYRLMFKDAVFDRYVVCPPRPTQSQFCSAILILTEEQRSLVLRYSELKNVADVWMFMEAGEWF